jgi:E3 ubiquitin-protein ligase MARCH6
LCSHQLALALSASRDLLRPGAFWFIQDPQERDIHPVRDILDRSSWAHMMKIVGSGRMYFLAVLLAAGTVSLIFRAIPNLLPFRWMPMYGCRSCSGHSGRC